MVQFGNFIFDSAKKRVLTNGNRQEIVLEPKLIDLLSLFLAKPNTIISRDELHQRLWVGSIVTDNAINKLVGNLRKALGDEAKSPRYIQTIPKRGYQLVCEVAPLNSHHSEQATYNASVVETNNIAQRQKSYFRSLYTLGGAMVLLLISGYYFWQHLSLKPDLPIAYSVPFTRTKGIEFSPQMHPDNVNLYYLNQVDSSSEPNLWLMNKQSGFNRRIKLNGPISRIIHVSEYVADETTLLIYLAKSQKNCGVFQVFLPAPSREQQVVKGTKKLFDCKYKAIKDVDYHKQQHAIYYTAQAENFWPSQVFVYDIATNKTITPTQPEPKGWGHHSIDISPDGEKLLIMSTDNDHSTHIYSLNLKTHEISKGLKFNRPVDEAVWHHDSEHVYYHSPPPSYQILKSNLKGENVTAIISVSHELSSQMVRLPDGKNLLFSTDQKNYNNRWLDDQSRFADLNNSTVADVSPIMFHRSEQYIFASKRSGQMQLYLGNYWSDEVKTLTAFRMPNHIGYMAISYDDKRLLLSMNNKVYQLLVSDLLSETPFSVMDNKHLIYTSELPIISLDWFGRDGAAITVVDNGTPRLIVTNLLGYEIGIPEGNWAYGLTDSEHPSDLYVIKQRSNALHRVSPIHSKSSELDSSVALGDFMLHLPEQFYHAKIDQSRLYYVTTENDIEYLHSVPLSGDEKAIRFSLSNFSNYDVTRRKIIVSDMSVREGDIYRTVY